MSGFVVCDGEQRVQCTGRAPIDLGVSSCVGHDRVEDCCDGGEQDSFGRHDGSGLHGVACSVYDSGRSVVRSAAHAVDCRIVVAQAGLSRRGAGQSHVVYDVVRVSSALRFDDAYHLEYDDEGEHARDCGHLSVDAFHELGQFALVGDDVTVIVAVVVAVLVASSLLVVVDAGRL